MVRHASLDSCPPPGACRLPAASAAADDSGTGAVPLQQGRQRRRAHFAGQLHKKLQIRQGSAGQHCTHMPSTAAAAASGMAAVYSMPCRAHTEPLRMVSKQVVWQSGCRLLRWEGMLQNRALPAHGSFQTPLQRCHASTCCSGLQQPTPQQRPPHRHRTWCGSASAPSANAAAVPLIPAWPAPSSPAAALRRSSSALQRVGASWTDGVHAGTGGSLQLHYSWWQTFFEANEQQQGGSKQVSFQPANTTADLRRHPAKPAAGSPTH